MTHYEDLMQKMTVEEMARIIDDGHGACERCAWKDEACTYKVCTEGIKKWLMEEQDIKANWVPCENIYDEGSNAYKCSNCGQVQLLRYGTPKEYGYNFCPHCGARMDEE